MSNQITCRNCIFSKGCYLSCSAGGALTKGGYLYAAPDGATEMGEICSMFQLDPTTVEDN